MKKYLFILCALLASLSLSASKPSAGGDSDYEQNDDATYYPAMILVEDGDLDEVLAELETYGVIILRHRSNILLAFVPHILNDIPDVGSSDLRFIRPSKLRSVRGVKKIEVSKPRVNLPLMKEARRFNNANLIAEGVSLPRPYDGRGVIVGVCDIGIDTRHPNFLNMDQTECRIRRVVQYEEQQGRRTVYSTPKEIYEWQTDNDKDWHATHVTGIAAGAHKDSGYYSLAPEADIVFTASQLSDVGLLAGVEDIIEYAKDADKPCVINLSMGNYLGPHDGTSLFARYLDLCAEDAIICLSAGNEGATGETKSMRYDFTEGQTELRVLTADWDGIKVTGTAEVWSPDATQFDFTFYWSNNTNFDRRKDVYPAIRSKDGEEVIWSISLNPEDTDFDETFASIYKEGYVKATAGISPLNGRYCVTLEFELVTDIYHQNKEWAEYWPAIRVDGMPGTFVDIYCGGGSFLRREKGFPVPDNKMNVSDLATGFKTISVGMMNNTALKDDALPGSGYAKGDVCAHSSSGTLNDGRKLPLTVAPGAYVISSISSAFMDRHPDYVGNIDDVSLFNDKNYYWIGTLGTSMSCPFVVGAIATWLQAYPLLTSEEAIEIILNTNQTSGYPDPEDPRHGRGWFNAYEGLQKVIELTKLKVGTTDSPEPLIEIENGMLFFANPTGNPIVLDIYGMTGIKSYTSKTADATGSLDLRFLPSGLYIVRVSPPSGNTKTLKIAI